MSRSPSPSAGRTLDIELSGQEIISIELDHLDPDASDLIDVLSDAQSPPWIWTKLAAEYWRQNYMEAAESLAQKCIESAFLAFVLPFVNVVKLWTRVALEGSSHEHNLSPIYSLRANMQIARAQKAPKLILQDARKRNNIQLLNISIRKPVFRRA